MVVLNRIKIARYSKPLLLIFLGSLGASCVEEFDAKTQDLETLLVVDGLITDELKHHRVQITRVFAFEAENPTAESGAVVQVVDGEGGEFTFEETEPGVYLSQSMFAAEQGKSYALEIATADGKKYRSAEVVTPKNIPIEEIRAQRMTNDREEEGIGIFLDNVSNGDAPTFFRYEYEETYKIVAPRWDPFRLRVVRYEPCYPDPFVVDIVTWEDERKTCFGSSSSTRLIQTSSLDLLENEVDNFQLHFISRENYIISHRYSMNVTQYSQTQDAYSFYERLGDFSSSDNIFSQIQPGFLEGNISLESNPNEMVLGYFEVASVSEKRMYFNYADLFPGEPLPPYAVSCEIPGNPRLIPRGYHCAGLGICDGNCNSPLIDQILAGQVVFASENEGNLLRPYFTWFSPCGDCTKLGSNVVPEFWTEE